MTISGLTTMGTTINTNDIPLCQKVKLAVKNILTLILFVAPLTSQAQDCGGCGGIKPIIGASYAIGKPYEISVDGGPYNPVQGDPCGCQVDNDHRVAKFDLGFSGGGPIALGLLARAQHNHTAMTYFNNIYRTQGRSFGPGIQLNIADVLTLTGAYTRGDGQISRQSLRNPSDGSKQKENTKTISLGAALGFKNGGISLGVDQQEFPITFPGGITERLRSRSRSVGLHIRF